jgi:uncharacterized hydrophobic protein (TIGR00271 family)
MLVSPLMGPIMGLGMGMAVYDLPLVRKALANYLFAIGAGLSASTLFFLVSPIDAAQSELLARTSPNIYDVLIALFGGLAGTVATFSTKKGNVLPGVAIATALMPPLCTAGYGLANLKAEFFFGAFYLFVINTVFIALATMVTARVMRFPFMHLPEKKAEQRAHRIVFLIVLVTILPSVYFGYDIVHQTRFHERANAFIDKEAVFPNDYLLKRVVNAKERRITLVYGGQFIDQPAIDALKLKLKDYELQDDSLEIRQGFAYLTNKSNIDEEKLKLLESQQQQILIARQQLDSIRRDSVLSQKVLQELATLVQGFQSGVVQPQEVIPGAESLRVARVYLQTQRPLREAERSRLRQWLRVRLGRDSVILNTLQ